MINDQISYDLTELLTVFDDLLPLTNEELKQYFLSFTRSDGIVIELTFSAYERQASISVSHGTIWTNIDISECITIRIPDLEKKCLEVIGGNHNASYVRCFLALLADSVLLIETDQTE